MNKPTKKILRLVPVQVFGTVGCGSCEHCAKNAGYGLMDAVSAWSDCNRAVGKIYRIDDIEPKYREPGETVSIEVREQDLPFFEKKFDD